MTAPVTDPMAVTARIARSVVELAERHACRGCGQAVCVRGDRSECERIWRSAETSWRLSLADQRRCPGCGRDVFEGVACVGVEVAA